MMTHTARAWLDDAWANQRRDEHRDVTDADYADAALDRDPLTGEPATEEGRSPTPEEMTAAGFVYLPEQQAWALPDDFGDDYIPTYHAAPGRCPSAAAIIQRHYDRVRVEMALG